MFRTITFIAVLSTALLAGCKTLPGPEEVTADGLVRVASRASGGVYRAPDATFHQYQRIMLEPPTIGFVGGWRKNHPEVSDSEVARIRTAAIRIFREEFTRDLVKHGTYQFADSPAPDVLMVAPAVEDLDIPAPDAGGEAGNRTYTPGPVKMKVSGEIRDSMTGKLVGRVICYQGDERYGNGELRMANRISNEHEQRQAFASWTLLLHEALSVAKADRPRR
ncbi:MAG: DUF3313 family protein [Pseudomonadota bacterium]